MDSSKDTPMRDDENTVLCPLSHRLVTRSRSHSCRNVQPFLGHVESGEWKQRFERRLIRGFWKLSTLVPLIWRLCTDLILKSRATDTATDRGSARSCQVENQLGPGVFGTVHHSPSVK